VIELPLIPIPNPVDPNKRILELESYLDPKRPDFISEQQHENIKTVIRLYKEGTIDGSKEVCVNEGKVISMEETFNRTSASFIEGPPVYELAEKYAYGPGQFGPGQNVSPF